MPWGYAAAAVAGSLVSGAIGADASRSAANTQADAARNATAVQEAQYQQTRSDLAPYMGQGTIALSDINKLMADPSMVSKLPGYQFQLQQGMDTIQNSAAAKGLTGNTLKALNDYGQGTASGYYNNYWNQLMQLANLGQTSAAGVGNIGASTANAVGSNIIGAGNAQAAGQVGSASAISGGINSGLQNWLLASQLQGGGGQQIPGFDFTPGYGGGYTYTNPSAVGPFGP